MGLWMRSLRMCEESDDHFLGHFHAWWAEKKMREDYVFIRFLRERGLAMGTRARVHVHLYDCPNPAIASFWKWIKDVLLRCC